MPKRTAKTPEATLAEIAAAIVGEINLKLADAKLPRTPATYQALAGAIAAEQARRTEEAERTEREAAAKRARRDAWVAIRASCAGRKPPTASA